MADLLYHKSTIITKIMGSSYEYLSHRGHFLLFYCCNNPLEMLENKRKVCKSQAGGE